MYGKYDGKNHIFLKFLFSPKIVFILVSSIGNQNQPVRSKTAILQNYFINSVRSKQMISTELIYGC